MLEYVYALHDFQPENQDEVSFRAGERVEVIEKDDLYGDGWWKGRNLAGQVGLFPQSYIAPAPPSVGAPDVSSPTASIPPPVSADYNSNLPLPTLHEKPELDTPPDSTLNIIAPKPQGHPSATFLNGDDTMDDPYEADELHVSDGEVMKATMTDVQKAIEQLGRSPNVDNQSISFASSRGELTEGETDYGISDVDGADGEAGESWHKIARRKLAAKAKQVVEKAEKHEDVTSGSLAPNLARRAAFPIEIELSDESESEEDDDTTYSNLFTTRRSYIPEETEGPEGDVQQSKDHTSAHDTTKRISSGRNSTFRSLPDSDKSPAPTVTTPEFPTLSVPPHSSNGIPVVQSSDVTAEEEPKQDTLYGESMIASESSNRVILPPAKTRYMSMTSNHSVESTASDLSPGLPSISSLATSTTQTMNGTENERKGKIPPSEWSVEDVADWLKSKGFDKDVCDKFIEQEISGDVLLDLNVNLLKNEIGIMAFGKRMRIANAITDLRRPPSITYSDHQIDPLSPMDPHSPAHVSLAPSQSASQILTHSRSQSHQSFSSPGFGPGHTPQRSPLVNQHVTYANGTTNGYGNSGAPLSDSPTTESIEALVPEGERKQLSPVGLGIGLSAKNSVNGKGMKARPMQLTFSPSDSALKASAKAVSDIPEEADEDRGHTSDGGAASTSMRDRIFRRSHDSKAESTANSRHSSSASGMQPPVEKERERSSRTNGKGGDRLSFFGGSLGKSRKPAPKQSSGTIEDLAEKSLSIFGIPKPHSSGSRKIANSRGSSASNGTEKTLYSPKVRDSFPSSISFGEETGLKEQRNPVVLRKRTLSAPVQAPLAILNDDNNEVVGTLKEGQSVLKQIGELDHSGWMRKKGDRYDHWKLRYFVLKGHHLYWMKTDKITETKVKGFLSIVGYKVTADENVNPGRYGFRIQHDREKTHYFSSEEKGVVREWMKAIMKATIDRDYSQPVISSCNIPTIPLLVAQTMNPAPRPPSPGARDATQRALRRENPNQLSSRDARVLMGLPSASDVKEDRTRLESFFNVESVSDNSPSSKVFPKSPVPPRPAREVRRLNSTSSPAYNSPEGKALIEWANSHLPSSLVIRDPTGSLCGGLGLLRIAESIKGHSLSPAVPDSAFPVDSADDKLEGLFRLFDFLLDNDVKMGSVSINDVRQEKRDKIIQLLKALKAWEDKRKAIAQSVANTSLGYAAGFVGVGSVHGVGAGAITPVWS